MRYRRRMSENSRFDRPGLLALMLGPELSRLDVKVLAALGKSLQSRNIDGLSRERYITRPDIGQGAQGQVSLAKTVIFQPEPHGRGPVSNFGVEASHNETVYGRVVASDFPSRFWSPDRLTMPWQT